MIFLQFFSATSLHILNYFRMTFVDSECRVFINFLISIKLLHIILMGFPDTSVGKESTCNAGDPGSIPWTGRLAGEGVGYPFQYSWAPLVAQLVKNLPAMRETWVRLLAWEDPLEKIPTPVFWPGEVHGLYKP